MSIRKKVLFYPKTTQSFDKPSGLLYYNFHVILSATHDERLHINIKALILDYHTHTKIIYTPVSNFIWSHYQPAPKLYWLSTAYKLKSKLLISSDFCTVSPIIVCKIGRQINTISCFILFILKANHKRKKTLL